MDGVLYDVLRSPLPQRDQPTATHYTVEGVVYWADELVDSVRAGLRRSLKIGGLRNAGQNNLAVELVGPLVPYEVARIRGAQATIICPAEADMRVRRADGCVEVPLTQPWQKAPFSAVAVSLKFHEQVAFRVGTLVFRFRFVHRDGKARHAWDWIPARIFPGYLG